MIADFRKKKNPLKQILLASGGALILLIAALLFIADVKIYKKKAKFDLQVVNLQNKIEDIRDKNEALKKDILQINDEKYIEKVAREELSLQKPGEKVVLFVKEGSSSLQEKKQEEKNFLQNWLVPTLNFFKKIMVGGLGWISNIFSK